MDIDRYLPRILVGTVLLVAGCVNGESSSLGIDEGPPYPPEKALELFEVPEGYRVELVASEPDIRDPIAMAFDKNGRLYVVEMPTYPISDEPVSKIKVLTDPNGDGLYEESQVFADSLHFPHGVLPWKEGIIVPDAPDVLYLADTDGDGHADTRKTLLTGFARVNPQLRVNTPLYGMDNWIYLAYPKFGRSNRFPKYNRLGDPIRFPDHPEVPSIDPFSKGMDLRFKPDEHTLEVVSGNSEYGQAFNDRGHRFTSWNNSHGEHVVIAYKYLARNPYLAVGSASTYFPSGADPARVYPITEDPYLEDIRRSSALGELGHFTSACGQSVYTGGAFSEKYTGAYFVCAPVHNLVHSDRLIPQGVTFAGKRAPEESAFLASTDPWFKPVFTYAGPDGALYVVDFYRKVVEHPEWIRKELADAKELFEAGTHKGRIYRVVYEEAGQQRRPQLGEATSLELVEELANPNRWWRITAQRLLVHRQDASVIPALKEMVRGASNAEGRMHVLWTLEGLGALDEDLVLRALEDENAGVREQAVQLAERYLSSPEVRSRLYQMTEDPDDRVLFQLACTLGYISSEESSEALKEITFDHIDDKWFRVAALTSAAQDPMWWFEAATGESGFSGEENTGRIKFIHSVTSIVGAKQNRQEVATLLDVLHSRGEAAPQEQQTAALAGLSEGLQRGESDKIHLQAEGQSDLLELVAADRPAIQEAALNVARQVRLADTGHLQAVAKRAAETALREEASVRARVIAIKTLGLGPSSSSAFATLEPLLTPQQPKDVHLAAAEVLADMEGDEVTQALLSQWETYTLSIREVIEKGFLEIPARTKVLLGAIERGMVSPQWLSTNTKQQLLRHQNEAVRQHAEALIDVPSQDTQAEVFEKYEQAVRMNGDAGNGEMIYREECSMCHTVGEVGFHVGPALADLSSKGKAYFLANIIAPNDNISAGYATHVIETTSGRTITGVIVEETATSVVVHAPGEVETTVLRRNIETMHTQSYSLMPPGLEARISVKEMADLLEYLQNLK